MGLKVEKNHCDDEQWTRRNGTKIWVEDMTEEHAKNCLRLLMRRVDVYNQQQRLAALGRSVMESDKGKCIW